MHWSELKQKTCSKGRFWLKVKQSSQKPNIISDMDKIIEHLSTIYNLSKWNFYTSKRKEKQLIKSGKKKTRAVPNTGKMDNVKKKK